MDPTTLVAEVRDHYVDQFVAFAARQRQSCTKGGSEVKLQLSETSTSSVFQRLYCVDFIKNDEKSEVIEFIPENILTFEPLSGSFGGSKLTLEALRWDDVVFHYDAAELPETKISDWFALWFDLDDERHDPEATISSVIHSLTIKPAEIFVDFGTSPPDAFWDILELVEAAGASNIWVGSSRDNEVQ
jgi:hypothetical protein